MKDKDSMENLYADYIHFASEKINQGASALEIAAIMITQGLSIYRTVFTEDEYEKMAASIFEKRNEIKTFSNDSNILH